MEFKLFLILLSFCFYLADSRVVDHNDNEDAFEGSDSDEFDDEAFSDNDDWFGDEDDESKLKQDSEFNAEESAIIEKVRRNQWEKHDGVKHSAQATDRLMKEIQDVYRSELYKSNAYSVELVDDSLYEWNVTLRSVDMDSELYKDLQKLKEKEGKDGIMFSFKFGSNYPFEPPFVRIVYPVILGNHIYEGGAICMELLTPQGWSSVYTVEMIITQLGAFIADSKGRIAFGAQDGGAEMARGVFSQIVEIHKRAGWRGKNNS